MAVPPSSRPDAPGGAGSTDPEFTPIAETGEFGLIDRLSALIGPPRSDELIVGIGDDAAVYRIDENRVHVLTSDDLFEAVHFDRMFMPMEHLGFKAISINVSDVAAMNAEPRYATVGLGIPNNFSVEMAESLYRGIVRASRHFDVEIVGGDTNAARRLSLSISVVGEAAEDEVVYRSGARPGDLIVLTGPVGGSYAGLQVLLEGKKTFEESGGETQPDLDPYQDVLRRHMQPVARTDVIRSMAEAGVEPRALIDVSDGVASDLHHVCEVSDVGATVEAGALPIEPMTREIAEEMGEDPEQYALFGGEDYELLMAMPEEDVDALSGEGLRVIGQFEIPQEGVRVETTDGERVALEAEGFDHFG